MFAMKLQEDIPGAPDPRRIGPCRWWLGETEYLKRVKDSAIDPAFRARKSWFFFDDCMVCLGSGITCEDTRYPINTTLFQNTLNLPGKQQRFALDGAAISAFPLESALDKPVESHWLMDSSDNGYWVPSGNNPLHILRQERALPYHTHWVFDQMKTAPSSDSRDSLVAQQDALKENKGEVELAWFDHGAAPAQPAGYEYAIVVDTTAETMRKFAAAPRYHVLRRDNTAHVVSDAPTKTTGYAIFEATADLKTRGLDSRSPSPQSVSKPCLLMLRETATGIFRVSFADPDPGLKPSPEEERMWSYPTAYATLEWNREGSSAGQTVTRVTFAGAWQVKGDGARVVEGGPVGSTTVEFHCVESQPVIVEFQPATTRTRGNK